MSRSPSFLICLALIFLTWGASAQISHGGYPLSLNESGMRAEIPCIRLPAPDHDLIRSEDDISGKDGLPPRIGVAIPVNAGMENAGSWTTLENGTNIWRLMLTVPGALAMSVSFSQFNIPAGGSLYLYDTRGDFIIGAFTSENNKRQGLFSTQLIPGDSIILEYASAHEGQGNPALWINHIGYAYRHVPEALIYQGRSGDCQVNVACPEGDLYVDQRSGVARIYLLDEGNYYWCSGSLVNNTARNRDPYFLTADHCAEDVSPSDLSQWVFYFNYVSSDCAEDIPPAANQTMSGAVLLAHAGTSGSDFLLLLLDDYVPDSYNPYFLGWNREDAPSPRGASLHHPDGDIMKISTYQEPLVSSQWSSSPGTHWQVYWSATENGWGVTEGGSSGSPLLDDEGFLVGTLTGGLSDCEPGGGGSGTGPDKPDYYGKFSESWDQNGLTPDKQLKPWLDPIASGATILGGIFSVLKADFMADSRIILVGQEIIFTDNSSGGPQDWLWTFEGGVPGTYTGKAPPPVDYPEAGLFSVTLAVSRGGNADTTIKSGYIQVVGKVYPNPAKDVVYIFLDEEPPAYLKVEIFGILGEKLFESEQSNNTSAIISADVSRFAAGTYFLRIQVGQEYLFKKVMVVR